MSTGNEHHRETPTGRTSSQAGSSQQAQVATHVHEHARPQAKPQSTAQSQDKPHVNAQAQSASQVQAQSASQAQSKPLTATSAAQTTAGAARKRSMLMPALVLAVLLVAMGGFGGSCMSGLGGSLGGATSGSGTYGTTGTSSQYGTAGPAGTYTISQDLGSGDASDTWTVLMYVCGSDLESTSTRLGGGMATSNLVELTQANLGSNVNYVIETGGATRWQNDVVSARYLERYAMEGGYMTLKDRAKSASMAQSSTLSDFITWGVKNYPADHYMLVFWDHGGGSITGVCIDEIYPYTRTGASDSLTLTEIREALGKCGVTFDVVGFDTCLMATIETAEILQPYASYMVASEESEPGTGWDYAQWPTWLASHPGTSGADLGTVICETYYNKCASVGAASTATLSTIDLSKVPALTKAFVKASDDIALATVDPTSLRQLYQAAGKAESYGNDGSYSMNMVDLGDLMAKAGKVVGSDADAVISAISDAVVCDVHGRNRSGASGISVFYPLQISGTDDFYSYAEITSNTPYLQFLGVMYGVYDNYDWTTFDNYVSLHGEPVAQSTIDIAFEQTVQKDGHVRLQITQGLDQVAQVDMEFYVYLDVLDVLCYLGSDNDLEGSYETGTFTDNFQNDWLTIDGNYVSATLCEQGDGYNLYYVPVNLNGDRTGLLLEYDYSTNEYGVLCAWDENDANTGMAGRTGRLLEDGDEIEFLFPAANATTGSSDVIPLATMEWHDDPLIAYEGLGDGTFAFRYAVTDVLGNRQKSELVFEQFEDGKFVRQTR